MYGRKSKPLCHNMSHRYTTEYTAVWWKHGCFFFINLSVGGWYLCVKRWRFIVFMFFWPFNFVKAHFHPQFFLFLWRSNTSIPHYNHSIGSSREMDNSSTSGIESLVEDWEFESPLGRWSFARNVIYLRSCPAYWGEHTRSKQIQRNGDFIVDVSDLGNCVLVSVAVSLLSAEICRL